MGTNGKTEASELVARCQAVGWQVVKTTAGHWRVDTRKGAFTVASTPSDTRSVKNSLAEARRYGLYDLEAKLVRSTEKDRQKKLEADRAANDAKLTKIQETNGSTAVTFTSPIAVTSEALGFVNGVAIVAIAPAMIKTPVMSKPAPLAHGEELLLADGSVVYRCARYGPYIKNRADGEVDMTKLCHQIFNSVIGLRTHIGAHTSRTLKDAAFESERAQENVIKTTTPATEVAKVTATTDQLKVKLTRGLTSLVQAIDKIGAGSIEARNAALKLVELVQDLKTEVVVQEPDPELVAKARQFDALAATLGALIK